MRLIISEMEASAETLEEPLLEAELNAVGLEAGEAPAAPEVADQSGCESEAPSAASSAAVEEEWAEEVPREGGVLKEGLVVELWHARRVYAAVGSPEALARSLGHFRPGTWCRCVVESYAAGEGYALRYEDGPYAAASRALVRRLALPPRTRFVRVPRSAIGVDYEASYAFVTREGRRQTAHGVVVVPLVVLGQLFCYFWYAARSGEALEMYAPLAGPDARGFAFAETSPFPRCADLRRREWYRFWTYQWIHEGWAHVGSNAIMQLVFGIPLEVAHGGWRTATILQFGVVAGALSVAVFDVQRNVVGASGACYALLGAHAAVICLHWHSARRGLLHRDAKLALFATLTACDLFTSLDRAASVGTGGATNISYSDHIGGFVSGGLLGVALLQRRPAFDARYGRKRKVFAAALLACLLALALAWIAKHAPPKDLPWLYPDSNEWRHRTCCSKLDGCADLDGPVHLLTCTDRTELRVRRDVASSCNDLRALLNNSAIS